MDPAERRGDSRLVVTSDLESVVEPFERARPLPRRTFVEDSFFRLDQAWFRRSWVPVAHATELSAPGSFVACDIGGRRVVAVRAADLSLSAFLDGCIHRGMRLFDEDAGRLDRLGFSCPYHGLAYDLRGVAIPASCPSLALEPGAALKPARVVKRFGFVFVCLDERTPDFDTWAGPAPPWFERAQLHALKLGRRTVHEARANWKLLVQNFQESHHFTLVHPSLEHVTPWKDSTSSEWGGRFLGGSMTLKDDVETVSDVPSREGRSFVAGEEDRRIVRDALLTPGWMTSLQPDYLLSYRMLPLAPDLTRIVADIYFHASAMKPGFEPRAVYSFWDRTNAEDRAICERQQRGLLTAPDEVGRYASVEDGVHGFDRRVAAEYLR